MSKFSEKLDYEVKKYNYPSYKLHRAVAQNGGGPIVLGTSGGTESIFEIPPEVLNFSRSFITGKIKIAGGLQNRNTWLYNSQMSIIDNIELYNASGVQLCDVKYLNFYTDVVSKPETKLSDFLTYPNDVIAFLERNNSNYTAYSSFRYDGTTPNLGYTEHKYLYHRSATNYVPLVPGDPLAVPPIPDVPAVPPTQEEIDRFFLLDLSRIKNTIFSYDKDQFFNEKLFLRIQWAASVKVFFTSAVTMNGANVNQYNPGNNPEEATTNVTLNNVQLYLAYETNENIKNVLKEQCKQGMVYRIPYVMTAKHSINSTTQNVTINFGPGSGQRLLKIYHALYNPEEKKNTVYDHSNYTFNRLNQYYTQLNQVKRQQFDVDCKKLEDYLIIKDRLKGSVIQNMDIYSYNYFILDDFTEDVTLDNNQLALGYDSGLPITSDLKWDIYCSVDSGIQQNHYTFSIVSRDLYVGPGGMRMQ